MAQASVREAVVEDLDAILPFCTVEELLALQELAGKPVREIMSDEIKSDHRPWAGLIDGNPVCLFGCYPETLITGRVFVWLLGSRQLRKYPLLLSKYAAPLLRHMTRDYDELVTLVDTRVPMTIRFAEWLGFRERDTIRPGLGPPYKSMELRRH